MKRRVRMRRKLTNKLSRNLTVTVKDENEVIVNPEDDSNSPKSPDPQKPTQRMGISNINRSLTLKKKIVQKEKPIKWTDRIALR